jgi:upstream activation factor subunit UAF30
MDSTVTALNSAAIDRINDKQTISDAPVQVDKKPEQNNQSITDPNKITNGASGAPPQPSTEKPASVETPGDPVKKNPTPPPPAPPIQDTNPGKQVTAPKEDAAAPKSEQPTTAATTAAPPTDDAIIARLKQLLKEVDLAVTTEKMLRKTLETEFSCNLTEKKPLLKEEIKSYLASQAAEDEEEEEEEEEEEDEDAPVKKKKIFHRFGVKLSDPMQAFLGMDTCPRPQVVKKLWEYIKSNDLQDPKNRRNIILDDKLKTIFPGNSVNMLTMNKHLSKHCFTSDGYSSGEEEEGGEGKKKKKAAAAASKKIKPAAKKAAPAASGSKKRKSSSTPTTGTGEPRLNGFTKKCKLSEDMAAWMGTSTASRPEITKKMWAYVKEKGLQDPANKSVIVADGTLKKLTGEDNFKGFSFAKYIKEHILGYVD